MCDSQFLFVSQPAEKTISMFYRGYDKHITGNEDDFTDIPASGRFAKWFGGVISPLALLSHGIWVLVTRLGVFSSHGMTTELFGPNAVAFGIASVSIGTFLHFHYFWGNLYHLSAYAVLGKILSLVGFIGSTGYLMVRVGVLGRH